MPNNVLQVGPQIFAVVAGIIVFFGAGLAFAFKYPGTSERAGGRAQQPSSQAQEGERGNFSGFIDSFAGVISEARGRVPFMAWIIMAVTLACYFLYLFLHWQG